MSTKVVRAIAAAVTIAGLLSGAASSAFAEQEKQYCEKDRCLFYSMCVAVTTNFGCNMVAGDAGCETYNCSET